VFFAHLSFSVLCSLTVG